MAEEKTTPTEPNASYLPGTPEESVSPEDTPAPEVPTIPEEPPTPAPNEVSISKITTPPAEPSAPQPEPPAPAAPVPSPAKKRHPLRIALALLTFIIGIVVGIAAVLLLILAMSGTNPPITTSPPQPGNITIQADATLIGPIAEKSLQDAGIPGKITNLQVQFDPGDQMTITGSYQYDVLSVSVTQNITIVLQPYVDSCNLQVHIIQANYGSIPVTGFASIFEKQINDKLQQAIPSTVLKGSYALCLSSVNTQTGSIILAFSATPLPS